MSVSSTVDDACLTQIQNLRITAPNHRFHSENVKRNACDTQGTDTYLDRIRSVAIQLTGLGPDDLSRYVSFLSRVHGVINAASPAVLFRGVVDMRKYCGGVEEEHSKRIRFYLKLITQTTTDLSIMEEMRTYDCDVFKNVARQPFFVQPLRIGDFNVTLTENKRKKRDVMKGFMLEDASLPEPRALFPGAPPCEKNTLAYLADFCNEQNLIHTFFDGIVVMMVPLLHYLDKTWKRSHGDLHWHNIFMTPVEDLYMNREGDTFVLRTEYDTKYSAKNAGLPRIVYGNVKTNKKILLNGIAKVFDWDQSEPYYTKSRAPNPEDDSETYRTTYTNEEGERVTEWVTESLAVHRMYRDKLAFFRCLKSHAREYYNDIIGKMVVDNPSEIVNFDYFLDNSAGFMGATDETGELLRDEEGDELPVTQVRLNGQNARPKERYASALESGDGDTLVMRFVSFEDPEDPEAEAVDRYHVEPIGDDMFYVNRENPCILELKDDVILLHALPPERFEGRFANGTSRLQRELVKEWAKENRNPREVNFEVRGQFYTLLNQYTMDDENMVRFGSQGARILCTTITLSTIDFMLEQFHIQAVTNILDARDDGTLTFPIASTDGHPKPKMQKATKRQDKRDLLRTVDSKQLTERVKRQPYAEEVRRPQDRRTSPTRSNSEGSANVEGSQEEFGEGSASDATETFEKEGENPYESVLRKMSPRSQINYMHEEKIRLNEEESTLKKLLADYSPNSSDNEEADLESSGDRDARASLNSPQAAADPVTEARGLFEEILSAGLVDGEEEFNAFVGWMKKHDQIKKDMKRKNKTEFDDDYIDSVKDVGMMNYILNRTRHFIRRIQNPDRLRKLPDIIKAGARYVDNRMGPKGEGTELFSLVSDLFQEYPFCLREYRLKEKLEEKLKVYFKENGQAEQLVKYLEYSDDQDVEGLEKLDALPPEAKRRFFSIVYDWLEREVNTPLFKSYF